MIRVIDVFSGIGGFSLGLESTGGFETVAFCEIEAFPREVLAVHWPEVPCFTDVRELKLSLGDADMIVGGFPCQDISVAGKGAGIDGERSGLWRELFRLVRECRPRWVLVENVSALRTRGADRVLADLEAEGYSCWPLVVGAWAVGAPHKRDRVWIVAHRDGEGRSGERSGGLLDGERAASGHDADGRCERPVGDAELARRAQTGPRHPLDSGPEPLAGGRGIRWPARPGEPQHEWEEPRLAFSTERGRDAQPLRSSGPPEGNGSADADGAGAAGGRRGGASHTRGDGVGAGEIARSPEQPLGSATDGLPERLVRLARRNNREALKACGNSVVPQIVAEIGRAILEIERHSLDWWRRRASS